MTVRRWKFTPAVDKAGTRFRGVVIVQDDAGNEHEQYTDQTYATADEAFEEAKDRAWSLARRQTIGLTLEGPL